MDNRSRALERPTQVRRARRARGASGAIRLYVKAAAAGSNQGTAAGVWDGPRVCRYCEMSELEQAFLRDAAHLIAIERTARTCRERGWVLT